MNMHLSKQKNKNIENLLKFCMWNIEGLTKDKLNDPHFHRQISDFSLISFVETWLGDQSEEVDICNFQLVHSNT